MRTGNQISGPTTKADDSRPHISTVPEEGFQRAESLVDLIDRARTGSDILYHAVLRHAGDESTWEILHKAHSEVVDAFCYMINIKYVGIPEWQERGAA